MNKKYKYHYLVPIIVKGNNLTLSPRVPKHVGFIAVNYETDVVEIEVSIGGHNYLKNRKYATFLF